MHAQVAAQRTVDLADLEKQLALVASLKNDAEADVADKQHQISTLQVGSRLSIYVPSNI